MPLNYATCPVKAKQHGLAEFTLKTQHHFMKVSTELEGFYFSSSSKTVRVRNYSTGRFIFTAVKNDVEWLDMELSNAITPWIRTGEYRSHILVIRDIENWADFKVIERIKLILNSFNLPGRIVIQDLTDCIKVIWAKE